jgi:hypothetical protein
MQGTHSISFSVPKNRGHAKDFAAHGYSETQSACPSPVSKGQPPFVSTRVVSGRRDVSRLEREMPQVAAWHSHMWAVKTF